jgi:hypothetical protein
MGKEDCALAYFIVFIILLFFVIVLSTCYIKQIKSEKFYTPRLQHLLGPIEPTFPTKPQDEFMKQF